MTPVLDEVDDLDPKTGHPAPLSTISDLVNAPRPGRAPHYRAAIQCRPTRALRHVRTWQKLTLRAQTRALCAARGTCLQSALPSSCGRRATLTAIRRASSFVST